MSVQTPGTLAPSSPEFAGNIHRNQVTFSYTGRVALKPHTVQGYEEQYLADTEQRRTAILELPSDTEGLNLARVDSYRQAAGAPAKEMRFLAPAEYNKALGMGGIDGSEPSEDSDGRYLELLDLVVVKRDPELEALNGPELTESNAVHELVGHASALDNQVQLEAEHKGGFSRRKTVRAHRLQTGFLVHDPEDTTSVHGTSLEEGFAEYERGQYVLELGRRGGFVTDNGEDFDRTKVKLPLPGHYWWLRHGEGAEPTPTYAPGAFTAAILEILIEEDAALPEALRTSRRSGDHSEVRDRMNAIIPGIYERIDAVQDANTSDGLLASGRIYFDVYDMNQPSVPNGDS